MSRVFGIKDITSGRILYESSTSLLKATIELVGENRIPFFALHDFNPEGQYHHQLSGFEVSKQFHTVIEVLERQPGDSQFIGMDKLDATGFFEELASYRQSNAFHRFTCYVFD